MRGAGMRRHGDDVDLCALAPTGRMPFSFGSVPRTSASARRPPCELPTPPTDLAVELEPGHGRDRLRVPHAHRPVYRRRQEHARVPAVPAHARHATGMSVGLAPARETGRRRAARGSGRGEWATLSYRPGLRACWMEHGRPRPAYLGMTTRGARVAPSGRLAPPPCPAWPPQSNKLRLPSELPARILSVPCAHRDVADQSRRELRVRGGPAARVRACVQASGHGVNVDGLHGLPMGRLQACGGEVDRKRPPRTFCEAQLRRQHATDFAVRHKAQHPCATACTATPTPTPTPVARRFRGTQPKRTSQWCVGGAERRCRVQRC